MSLVREERDARLRLGPGASGFEARGSSGVLLFVDIPPGLIVHARVDRPTELLGVVGGPGGGELSDGGAAAGATQPYRFERAQMPATFIAGGVSFMRPRTLQRAIVLDSKGRSTAMQEVPAFAAFAPVQDGALVQKGRKEHAIQMPGGNLLPADRHVLRCRWTGTAVVGEIQASPPLLPGTPDGTRRSFTGNLGLAAGARNIAPGSVTITATVTALLLTIRDDGQGRLVGIRRAADGSVEASVDGLIDYVQGTYSLVFGSPAPLVVPDAATNIVASYEKDCRFKPLDIHVEWDSQLQ